MLANLEKLTNIAAQPSGSEDGGRSGRSGSAEAPCDERVDSPLVVTRGALGECSSDRRPPFSLFDRWTMSPGDAAGAPADGDTHVPRSDEDEQRRQRPRSAALGHAGAGHQPVPCRRNTTRGGS